MRVGIDFRSSFGASKREKSLKTTVFPMVFTEFHKVDVDRNESDTWKRKSIEMVCFVNRASLVSLRHSSVSHSVSVSFLGTPCFTYLMLVCHSNSNYNLEALRYVLFVRLN